MSVAVYSRIWNNVSMAPWLVNSRTRAVPAPFPDKADVIRKIAVMADRNTYFHGVLRNSSETLTRHQFSVVVMAAAATLCRMVPRATRQAALQG